MKVYRGNISEVHSCNCCSKSKLKNDGFGLEYPYSEVTVIEGRSISIRLCDECLDELKKSI